MLPSVFEWLHVMLRVTVGYVLLEGHEESPSLLLFQILPHHPNTFYYRDHTEIHWHFQSPRRCLTLPMWAETANCPPILILLIPQKKKKWGHHHPGRT